MVKNMITVRKYVLFVIGLFFVALGVSVSVKAGIGVSPISSVAYVVSSIVPLSLGTCLFLWNILLLVLQIVILRKRFNIIQLMQIPLSVVFGFFTDFTKYIVAANVIPDMYIMKLIYTVIGSVSIALGIALSLIADVVLNPGEGFVKAISDVSGKKFGNVKVIVDVSFVALAAVLSFAVLKEFVGIREGTLMAAVFIGLIVKVFMRFIVRPVKKIMKI